MSFRCPRCHASSRTRNSVYMNAERTIKNSYCQCNNLLCGTTFCVTSQVSHIISKGEPDLSAPPVPAAALPEKHRGDNQIEMAI